MDQSVAESEGAALIGEVDGQRNEQRLRAQLATIRRAVIDARAVASPTHRALISAGAAPLLSQLGVVEELLAFEDF